MLFFIYLKDVLFSFQPILHCRFFFLTTSLTGSGTFFRFQILLVPVPVPKKNPRKSEHLELETLDTFAMIRKCWAKTSVQSFVPSLQWSPSRFVTGWCHRGKNFCICQFFLRQKNRIKSAQSRRPIWQVMCAVYLRVGVVSHHQLFNPCFIQCM